MNNKLAVVGAGHVGSYVLSDAMKVGLFSEIVVIDQNKDVAFGEALDQAHTTALPYMTNIDVYAGDYEDVKNADLIVISAGPSIIKSEENKTPYRTLLAEENGKNIREIMAGITKYTTEAINILITNQLDTMVYIAENEFFYHKVLILHTEIIL